MEVTKFEDAIKAHLDNLAKTDKLFAVTYAKTNKSIEECCKYIYQEVQKQRKGQNCVGVKDEDVFQLAIHYYDEDDIKVDSSVKPVVKVASDAPKTKEPEEKPKTKKKSTKKKAKAEDDGFEEFSLDIPLFA